MNHKLDSPLVSIIISTFNRVNYLEQMLDSIIQQSYKNMEIIIVDDGSTDNTKKIIEEYQSNHKQRIIFFEGGKGPGINRLLAYKKILGAFVVFCDDDDYFTDNNFIKKSVTIMTDIPDVSIICYSSDILFMKDNILEPKILSKEGIFEGQVVAEKFITEYPKPNSTFPSFYRRSTFEKNGFDEVKSLNDTNIYLRGILGGKVYYSKDSVGVYRIHSGSIGNSLDLDFIIQVLEEKKNLSKYMMASKISQNKWMYTQTLNTTNYYADRSKTIEYSILLGWVRSNLNKIYYFKIACWFIWRRIKYQVKRILKRKNPYL